MQGENKAPTVLELEFYIVVDFLYFLWWNFDVSATQVPSQE